MSQVKFKPKQLKDQTIVITGATSSIGIAVAKLAAVKGSAIVLADKNSVELESLKNQITGKGGRAIALSADITKPADLINLRDLALESYGSIDTWINAGTKPKAGHLLDTDIDDERELFETNFWGTRIGSNIAVLAMKDNGGVLINLGSEPSIVAQPLFGIYSASKQALKAFTEALRSELKDRNIPVEVSLVRPATTDTEEEDAEAILKCAESPQRDVYVGGPARLSSIIDTFFPTVMDMLAESNMKEARKADITAGGVFKTIKENFRSSLKETGKEEGH